MFGEPDPELVEAALSAQRMAYAPHSGYAVGAAIRGADGQVYSGCNVENDSFGLCLCAERSAISQMVLAGCLELLQVVVVTPDGGTPCGMCRQSLVQFAPQPEKIVLTCLGGATALTVSLAELLPHGFRLHFRKGSNR